MFFQMYIKDDRNQWDIYGAGTGKFMTDLFQDYVEAGLLYGHHEKEFKVIKSYQQANEADRPRAYCPCCETDVTYQVRHGLKQKTIHVMPNEVVDYRAFTCHCEQCQTIVEVPHYECLTHQNYLNARKD